MTRFLLGNILVVTLLGGVVAPPSGWAQGTPRWPLDLPHRYLTSSFMEYRPGRYHAGLDLKTQSRMGFAVHAAETGCVVRLRATARAYGRAVYVQTPGGKTYVYAHLSRFADDLQAKITAAQAASGTYRTELYFQPGELCVAEGEILGLTGQSGTGGPHLHFEVRDGSQHPLNPLTEGFAVDDTFPPVIYSLHAVPMTPAATVAGETSIMICGQPDQVALPDTLPLLPLDGPVAFTARVVDYGDVRGHRLEPWLLTVFLDGQVVYRAQNSTFSFASGSRERLEWFDGFSPRERWLFKRDGVDVPGRTGSPWPLGVSGQGLKAGRHQLKLVAQDYAGGTSAVVLPLMVGSKRMSNDSGWRAAPLREWAGSPESVPEPGRLNPFFSRGMALAGYHETALRPDNGDPVLEAVSLWSRPWLVPGPALIQALAQHLEPTPWAAEFLAGDWPLESAVKVKLFSRTDGSPLPEAGDRSRARVYRWTGKRWANAQAVIFPAGGKGPSGALSFALTRPGQYAMFFDQTAPQFAVGVVTGSPLLVGPGPAQKWDSVTPPRWEVFPVGISDQGSGLDPSRIQVTLDGKILVVEPDLPRQRILVELPGNTEPGPHDLHVAVEDQCGNSSQIAVSIICRQVKTGQ